MSEVPGPSAQTQELTRLALAHDVLPSYRDLGRNEVEARPESIVAALRAMGVIDSERDITDALRRTERDAWDWLLSPVTVAWDGRIRFLELRLPQATLASTAECRIDLEDGEPVRWTVALSETQVVQHADVEGVQYAEVRIAGSDALPMGYHRLSIDIAGRRLESLVISAPQQAYPAPERRSWGVFLPLHALHTQDSWGIGDYTDLSRFVEWCGAQEGRFVGTLPLLPVFLDRPYEPSPYQPVSRLLWNEAYIDVQAPLPDGTPVAFDPEMAGKARLLTSFEEVPYRAVMGLKRRALEAQVASMAASPGAMAALDEFVAKNPLVREYAAFRAAIEKLGPQWRDWPDAARWGTLEPEHYDNALVRMYEFAQWRAEGQMALVGDGAREAGVRLYLDMPVGVHPDGFDAWRYRSLFAPGMSLGAPPDLLASNGQDWGAQPLAPATQRATGYEYLIAHLRHCLSRATLLRVDHAIGLHRLYWIPEGGSGRDGVFVKQPAEELYAVLCLESWRHEAILVGEDLGLVPPDLTTGLREHGISSMYVQMFEMTGESAQPVEPPPEAAIASFGTHDLPTFAAYWADEDLNQRRELGLLEPGRVEEEIAGREEHRRALESYLRDRGLIIGEAPDVSELYRGSSALLAESDAAWLSLNLEDTWGETRSQNMPGTSSTEHPNWVARAAYSLEEFDSQPGLTEALKTIKQYRHLEARANEEGG